HRNQCGECPDSFSLQSCCCDRLVEVIRQRSFETFPFAGARVTKTQLPSVQHLAGKIFSESRRVDFVTQHRITKMTQMHPNLMCAHDGPRPDGQSSRLLC